MISITLAGRIDELDTINTPDLLEAWLVETEDQGRSEVLAKMFEPLGLMPGTYMVSGIEGQYYDGYEDSGQPWPLEVTEAMSAFDIMQAVVLSEANGYPDINHVWFESLEVDVMALTLRFGMGS